jgi:putative oxidoreductase
MEKLLRFITVVYPSPRSFHLSLLIFRVAASVELIVAHGLKKIGIGVEKAEVIPNPFHLPEGLNSAFAIGGNLFFPLLIIAGLLTRLAILPVLMITLAGYFFVHWHDPVLVRDTPYIYSIIYLLLLVLGPGKYSVDFLLHKSTTFPSVRALY